LLGPFERGMKVKQGGAGKFLSVNNAITFMARDRSTTDEAYPGDIIGIPNHGTIRLGETFTEGEDLRFTGIPSFAPEHFRLARIANPLKIKQLQKGLQQLAEEGATQLFRPLSGTDLILGAVGTLQFDVVASRLENEYGVQVIFESYNCATARWIQAMPPSCARFPLQRQRGAGWGRRSGLSGAEQCLSEHGQREVSQPAFHGSARGNLSMTVRVQEADFDTGRRVAGVKGGDARVGALASFWGWCAT
jgi:hypothetical protein